MAASQQTAAIRRVAIIGGGVAAWLTAAFLRRNIPSGIDITVAGEAREPVADALYGAVLPPEFYTLHSEIGVDEPTLLARTGAGFAFGTHLAGWGEARRDWVQPFHLPLSAQNGVPVHIFVAQDPQASLQPLLVSAVAAQAGRFAHPPEGGDHPLARAEYGYIIDPAELSALYREQAGVSHSAGSVEAVEREGEDVRAIVLSTGQRVEADLFIDATGSEARLLGTAGEADRTVRYGVERQGVRTGLRQPCAHVTASDHGWAVEATSRSLHLRVAVGGGGEAFGAGLRGPSWRGNVIGVGQSACAVEPLTVAPLRLLLRDVRRVADLFPVSTRMEVERREFNAAASDDQVNALVFHHAHFHDVALPDAPYWRDAAGWTHERLSRKLGQYRERAYLVNFDFEPFYALDWAVLHDGLGRTPRRTDALARAAGADALPRLAARARQIQQAVAKLPPHPVYVSKLLDYLARKTQAGERHAG